MSETRFSDLLSKAWQLRWEQRNREAALLLSEIQREPGLSNENRTDVELLRVSLLRAQGNLQESNDRLELLNPDCLRARSDLQFKFYLQKALNYFKSDFAISLEYFLLADRIAPTQTDRLICLNNAMTCMDNLGLPWQHVLEEAEKIWTARQSESSYLIEIAGSQLRQFRFRAAFRNGDVKDVFSEKLPRTFDQAEYLRLWISKVPFLKPSVNWKDFDSAIQMLALTDSFHMKAYRLATLTFDSSSTATDEVTQQADRLYLWTWAWLVDPSERRRLDLASVLKEIDFRRAVKQMTFEDTQMFANALRWIAVFQSKLKPWIDSYVATLPKSDLPAFPVFAEEKEWIDAFTNRDLKAIDALIQRNPESGFAASLRGALASMKSALENLPKSGFIVDERNFEITKGRAKTRSAPLVALIRHLADQGQVSFAEALWIGFEIAPYDSGVHQPKIYNLLARLKSLLPKTLKLSTKSGVIYLDGRIQEITFVSPSAHEKSLFGESIDFTKKPVVKVKNSIRGLHPRALIEREKNKHQWTRDELQSALQISRAGTQRWIATWESQGLLRREGAGRSSSYRLELADHLRLSDSR